MPRPGPARPQLAIRIADTAIAHINELAAKRHVTRSEMVRILLKEAVDARQAPERAPRRWIRDS